MSDQASPLRLAIDQPSQRRGQAEVVKHRRPQVEHEVAHLINGEPDDAESVLNAGLHLGTARALEDFEIGADRGEGLTDFAVQLPRRVATFGLP